METWSYFFRSMAPSPVGLGKNISEVAGISSIKVDKVKPPYKTGSGETVEVKDFWKDGPVVLHLLRRFG